MYEHPRKKLQEIINKYGISICSNHLTLEGLLRDTCPKHRKEVFALICAIREGIVADLLALSSTEEIDLRMKQLAIRLKNNLCLSRKAARWAVESWALALKIIGKRPAVRTIQHKSYNSQQEQNQRQKDMATINKGAQSRAWDGNSYAMLKKIVESTPKPFRQMTERKILETLNKKAGHVERISEDIIIECIIDFIPKPFKTMALKTIEPLRTRKAGFVWQGRSRQIFEDFVGMYPSIMSDMARTRLTNELAKKAQFSGTITEKMVIDGFRKVTSGSFFMDALTRIQELRK